MGKDRPIIENTETAEDTQKRENTNQHRQNFGSRSENFTQPNDRTAQ